MVCMNDHEDVTVSQTWTRQTPAVVAGDGAHHWPYVTKLSTALVS